MLRYGSKKQIKILVSKALYKILSSLAYMIAIEELFLLVLELATKTVILGRNTPHLEKPSCGLCVDRILLRALINF